MGFDNIDKKFVKTTKPVILAGPWYIEAGATNINTGDSEAVDDVESFMEMYEVSTTSVVHFWKIAAIEEFFAVSMPLVGKSGEYETKQFPTVIEANAWINQRSKELESDESANKAAG